MGLQARKLTFDGDTTHGQAVFIRVYESLIISWQNKRPEGLRDFLRLLDAMQAVSVVRPLSEEMLAKIKEAAAARGVTDWEQGEHDRVLKPGPQPVLLTDADYKALKGCFDRTEYDPRHARFVEAARVLLENAPLVEADEKPLGVGPHPTRTRGPGGARPR